MVRRLAMQLHQHLAIATSLQPRLGIVAWVAQRLQIAALEPEMRCAIERYDVVHFGSDGDTIGCGAVPAQWFVRQHHAA